MGLQATNFSSLNPIPSNSEFQHVSAMAIWPYPLCQRPLTCSSKIFRQCRAAWPFLWLPGLGGEKVCQKIGYPSVPQCTPYSNEIIIIFPMKIAIWCYLSGYPLFSKKPNSSTQSCSTESGSPVMHLSHTCQSRKFHGLYLQNDGIELTTISTAAQDTES